MQIVNFTPWTAFMGGLLIGISAAVLYVLNGKIAGISGILSGLLTKPAQDWGWRGLILLGMITGAAVIKLIHLAPETITITSSMMKLVGGGLLVGIGTLLGSGCTSGHGICGVSRLSMRSIVATILFLVTGMLTVYVIRHVG